MPEPGRTVTRRSAQGNDGCVRSEVSLIEAESRPTAVVPAGIRWEIYGPHNDDPAQQWTEVWWLLA